MSTTLKPRKFTLRMVVDVLSDKPKHVWTADEIAEVLGCAPATIKLHLDDWIARVTGIRRVKAGWKLEERQDYDGFAPPSMTYVECVQRIAELEAEIVQRGGVVHRAPEPAPRTAVSKPVPRSLAELVSEPATASSTASSATPASPETVRETAPSLDAPPTPSEEPDPPR